MILLRRVACSHPQQKQPEEKQRKVKTESFNCIQADWWVRKEEWVGREEPAMNLSIHNVFFF